MSSIKGFLVYSADLELSGLSGHPDVSSCGHQDFMMLLQSGGTRNTSSHTASPVAQINCKTWQIRCYSHDAVVLSGPAVWACSWR